MRYTSDQCSLPWVNNGLSRSRTYEYYYSVRELRINDSDVEICGTMGTSHTPTIKVQVRPRREKDFPVKLKKLLNPKY